MVSITNTSISSREFNEEGPVDGLVCAPSPFTLTEWPDGPTPTYFRNNNFTAADILEVAPTASRWAFYNGTTFASGVLSIESGKIKVNWPSGAGALLRLGLDPRNLTVRLKITSTVSFTANINNDGQNFLKTIVANVPTVVDVSFLPTTGTVIFDLESVELTAKVVYLEMAYVGDGSYTSKALDTSGNGNSATVAGATPISTTVGKGFSFDGYNDRLEVPNFTMPDIFQSHIIMPGGFSGINKSIFSYKADSATIGFLWIYRTGSGDTLNVRYTNGSAQSDVLFVGYFTGFASESISIDCTINWLTRSVTVYRNGVSFGSGTMTTPVKPTGVNSLYIGAYQATQSIFIGTIADPRIYNRALTEVEVKQLYKLHAQ